jgi:hypothetical protein
MQEDRRGTRRVRLTRSIILAGHHAEEGSVHDVSHHLALHLIGDGSAVRHIEEGEEPDPVPGPVTRMLSPTNADPKPRQVRPAPPRVKK